MAQIGVTKVRVQGKIQSDEVGGELTPLSISCVPASVLGALHALSHLILLKLQYSLIPTLRDKMTFRSTTHHISDGGLIRL